MLGGGTFVAQNKKLPGAYINVVSASRASAELSDRGIVALPLSLNWGVTGKAFKLTSEDMIYNTRFLLGYEYSDKALIALREAFKHAREVIVYRLDANAKKATCTYCDAKFGGVRGNDLKVVITQNVDQSSKFDVKTYLGTVEVDVQHAVGNTSELVDNEFVVWKDSVAVELTASTPLTGGENGTVTSAEWNTAFKALESESFNTLGVIATEDQIKDLAIAYTKRMRDELGVKFQTVVFNKQGVDDKGVINVVSHIEGGSGAELVAWVTGAQGGCAVNASCTNMTYDGEYTIDVNKSQPDLEAHIDNGEFVFHKVGENVNVLVDINSKVTVSEDEGEDFKSNQTIRVIDQIANDTALLFNTRYLGKVPNDASGRISLWNDVVKLHQDLERMRAIEDFVPEEVIVSKGNDKKSVMISDAVQPVNAMEKLYMTCVVS